MKTNEKTDNRLVLAEHPEFGIWYFTSEYKAAKCIGVQGAQVIYAMSKGNKINGWEFKWVDGSDVLYKFVNPSKEEVERDFDF